MTASARMPSSDAVHITRALELARRGEGFVEPNPMVGCVVVGPHGEVLGEGWHERFGGPHAEVIALQAAGERAAGGTLYVTLEPCCHHGKTPPCTQAILQANVRRVVVAHPDPFPKVAGGGVAELRAAGVEVTIGVLQAEAREVLAPYLKLTEAGRPWVIAKWAMTLDGKIATRTGDSRWISNDASRAIVHALRGRVDAVLVGRGTAEADDPLLTARPPGARVATRVVLDTEAHLPLTSQLVQTAGDAPVLIAVGESAPRDRCQRLAAAGCEIHHTPGGSAAERLNALLHELGLRRMTNILVEGGSKLFGALFDGDLIDEFHIFIAPKLIGGKTAPGPIAGHGIAQIPDALQLSKLQVQHLNNDLYLSGRNARTLTKSGYVK